MRFLKFFCFLVGISSNAHEIIVSSSVPIPGAIHSIEYKGKYISLIDSDCSQSFNHARVLNENVQVENNTDVSISYNEPVSKDLWNLDSLDGMVDNDYKYLYSGNGVNAYVIDSGISHNKDFGNRILSGKSFISNNTKDCLGHGTHVASILGSKTYGVAKNVTIIPVKIFDCISKTPVFNVISAVYWVIKQKKGIVNLSLSGNYNKILNDAIQDLINEGFIVVVAAGNHASDACNFSPSSEKDAIVVGCSTKSANICNYSNIGLCVTLFAPGDFILGINAFGSKPVYKSGTSMSSPHTAGVAAMLYEKYPGILQKHVKYIITSISKNSISKNSTKLDLRAYENQYLGNCNNLSLKNCVKNPLCLVSRDLCVKANFHTPTTPTILPLVLPTSLPTSIPILRNQCIGLSRSICKKKVMCSFIKGYGCKLFNFCGYKTRKECNLSTFCKYTTNKCALK